MTDHISQASQGEFVLFTSTDGQTRVECRLESDTLWFSQAVKQTVVQALLKESDIARTLLKDPQVMASYVELIFDMMKQRTAEPLESQHG